MRKHYLDNLRASLVILVVFYHICYILNGVGIEGGVYLGRSYAVCDSFARLVYPFFMVALFAVSGMVSRIALRNGRREYMRKRVDKLLVPSTLGLLAFHFITGYLNTRPAAEYFESIHPVARYFIYVFAGTGVMWFAQLLFVYSAILVLLVSLDRDRKAENALSGMPYPVILALSLAVWASSFVLNAKTIVVYRFGIYLVSFLLGYYVLSGEEAEKRIIRYRFVSLSLAAVSAVLYMVFERENLYVSPESLEGIFTNLYAWFMTLALIGMYGAYMDRTGRVLSFLSARSYDLYVFHYTAMLASVMAISGTGLPLYMKYIIPLLIAFIASYILGAIVRRLPVLRYLILGMRCNRRKAIVS
ncbi:MAG: acyltransferase [Candidatus Ornithospirochaeta sp.]|nr:acyltransferase [Candidatus Ornithospirochaeta sp.]